MKKTKTVNAGLTLIPLSATSAGCATYRTISEAEAGGAMVYSGTRLDINACTGDEIGLKKFKTTPPSCPLADLPFGFLLDSIILPATFFAAAYDFTFVR